MPEREALGGPEPGDRLHLGAGRARLALDVRQDPRREREPVAEAGVDRVLEVRVRVDEARHDRGAREVLAGAELVAVPTAAIRPSSIATAPSRSARPRRAAPSRRRAPSGRQVRVSSSNAARSQRRSMTLASRIESSNRISSGSTSSASETGSTVGSRIAKTTISTMPMRRFRRSRSAVRRAGARARG